MKFIVAVLIVVPFLLSQKSFASEQRVLPNVFYVKCEGNTIFNLALKWLVKFDRKNKTSQVKIPYVDNGFRICSENEDEITIKRDCAKGLDVLKFNKWDGSFQSSKPCKILDVNQKPLYK